MKYIDLSHDIESGMITYKGLPAPIVCDYLSREKAKIMYATGEEFQIGKIEMVTNTGTYLDCPFHRYEHGKDLSETHLEQLANVEGVLIDAEGVQDVGMSFFENRDVFGKAVLIHTGWAKHWRTDAYFENHPFLSTEAAEYLVSQHVILVVIDSHNIDDTRTMSRPVHSTLLKHEILIVEHACNLDKLRNQDFLFSAVPPKFKGVGTFPVRAFATIKNTDNH